MLQTIGAVIRAVFFLLTLWAEKDKKRAEEKKKVADEITEAFKETDPKQRASKLNAAIAKLRK